MQKKNSQIQINCSRLLSNIQVLSKELPAEMEKMAVIKSDAYGHGAVEVARRVEALVDAFAVNDIQEAVELREHDIKASILVFEPPSESSASVYPRYQLTATVSAIDHFTMLPAGSSYHLNFDTGMRRFGFRSEQVAEVLACVEENSQLTCTGLYSHFATADTPSSREVRKQQQRFEKICSYFPSNIKTHIANTGGTAFYEFNQYDMVRLGIGMYGYSPGGTDIEGLQPVLSWDTHLVAVNRVKKGERVSYGGKWKAPEDGFIGVIPVGYEDGLRRGLSGQISAYIDDQEYEVAGTITMNYTMIYLNDTAWPVGTQVMLLNDNADASGWAEKTGTIPYEILTGIGRNIPRTYKK